MATMTISLPATIARQVDDETVKNGFATRSEFIRSLLRRYFTRELTLETFEPQPLEEVRLGLAQTGRYNQKFIDSVVAGLKKFSQSSLTKTK